MNISNQLHEYLSADQLKAVKYVSAAASVIDKRVFLVGGAVRDLILGREIKDIDMAVECYPRELLSSSNDGLIKVISSSEFETVKIEIYGQIIDLSMTRCERYVKSGSLPQVYKSRIESDLSRRDFTINALAAHVDSSKWGEILDPHNGVQDLRMGLIKVLHHQSFTDDPTRIFRAARYATRLSFELEKTTRESMIQAVVGIGGLSGTRILSELDQVFEEINSGNALENLDEWGAFKAIHPKFDISTAALAVLKNFDSVEASPNVVGLLSLVYGLNRDVRKEIGVRLKLSSPLSWQISNIDRFYQLRPDMKNSEIYEKLNGLSLESLYVARSISSSTNVEASNQINLYLNDLADISISVTGNDLINLGIPEGPLVGTILSSIHEKLLDDHMLSRKEQLELAKNIWTNTM